MSVENDKKRIRELAKQYMELAQKPVMEERKRLWKAVHDLRMVRPMILIETATIEGFIEKEKQVCEDTLMRAVERNLMESIRHAAEIGDDVVLEPYFRMGWQMELSGFGVSVETKPGLTAAGETSLGYTFNFPIQSPDDLKKLKKRTIRVDRERTARLKQILEDAMGDILPVRIGNYDPFFVESGDEGWAGLFFFGLTWQIYRFIGNDRLLYWLYDEPETIHKLMRYMTDQRIHEYEYMEKEELLVPNTDTQMAGPRFYGYVSDLKGPDEPGPVRLKDLWAWPESQETTMVSPDMYNEFILPYLAELSSRFGLTYYGCCEPVDDRFDLIRKAIPNLRAFSISGWANFAFMGEKLGKDYVYSRKPTPSLISGGNPDWNLVEADVYKTQEATKNSNLEFLFRDIYTINHDWPRLRKWVDLVKATFGI